MKNPDLIPSPSKTGMEVCLDRLREIYDDITIPTQGLRLGYRRLLARYYAGMISPENSVLEIGCGDGSLLELLPGRIKAGIDLSARQIELAQARLPEARLEIVAAELFQPTRTYDIIILSDTLNQAADCQRVLEQALQAAHPGTRLLINIFNSLWNPIFFVGRGSGLAVKSPQLNWLTRNDVVNFLQLSGWEYVRESGKILIPIDEPIVAGTINRWLAPWLSWFCLTLFIIARPRPVPVQKVVKPSVSIIIPARNEAGNLIDAMRRIPVLADEQEYVFVEGHSKDETWEVMQKLPALFPEHRIKVLRQTGRGKANAVWEGFAQAEGEVLMILDADLTMPPEELPKFYHALCSGKAEFANGVRLVYPIEQQAMPFLNLCANKFFAIVFTWLLEQPVKDTLCGTKVLRRVHYDQIAARRAYFGNFDPFGDFDLLFGAARLNLKIADIPIRYRERTYGETNIRRWRHGMILLGMAIVGARKLKFC